MKKEEESMRNFVSRVIIFLCLFSMVPSLTFAQTLSEEEKLERVRFFIENYYYKQVAPDVLQQQTIQATVEKLDPYSKYMTYEELKEFLDSISPSVSGVGIYVEKDELGLRVIDVFEESDAKQAGLRVGDIIVEVDGHSMVNRSLEEAVSYLQGEEGTYVQLRVYRPDTNEYVTVVTRRQTFDMPLVFHQKLGGNIGYIALFSFDEQAVSDMQNAIVKLGNVNGYIIDLRYNGGGYIESALKFLGLFSTVPHATLIKARDEQEMLDPIIQPIQFQKPVSLLVNGFSASASEMVAAALRDYNAATLYGQTTFGKGTMQQIFTIDWDHPDESDVLKLTVAEFFSPKGQTIHQVGVPPHIVTAEGEELIRAHHDALRKQHAYKKLKELEKRSGGTELVVTFSAPIDSQTLKNEMFQLVELGGEDVPLMYEVVSDKQVKLRLSKPLKLFHTYVLYIHPQAKSENRKAMKTGYEIIVHVK